MMGVGSGEGVPLLSEEVSGEGHSSFAEKCCDFAVEMMHFGAL